MGERLREIEPDSRHLHHGLKKTDQRTGRVSEIGDLECELFVLGGGFGKVDVGVSQLVIYIVEIVYMENEADIVLAVAGGRPDSCAQNFGHFLLAKDGKVKASHFEFGVAFFDLNGDGLKLENVSIESRTGTNIGNEQSGVSSFNFHGVLSGEDGQIRRNYSAMNWVASSCAGYR